MLSNGWIEVIFIHYFNKSETDTRNRLAAIILVGADAHIFNEKLCCKKKIESHKIESHKDKEHNMDKSRKIIKYTYLILVVCILAAAFPKSALADTVTSPTNNEVYYIRTNGLYLTANTSTNIVYHQAFTGAKNQQWEVLSAGVNDAQGRPTYYLKNRSNGKCLQVNGTSSNLILSTQSFDATKHFAIAANTDVTNPDYTSVRFAS